MDQEEYYTQIVDDAIRSVELEGFSPSEEDRRLAYLCVTGQMTFEEALEIILKR